MPLGLRQEVSTSPGFTLMLIVRLSVDIFNTARPSAENTDRPLHAGARLDLDDSCVLVAPHLNETACGFLVHLRLAQCTWH